MEYDSENAFNKSLKYANQIGGFDIYINSIQFKNNIEQLSDSNNNPLGLIYNLSFIPPQQPLKQSLLSHNIKNNFKNHPLIGLQYIAGFPNYMNAVIQSFCQNEKVVNYFKYNKDIENIFSRNNNMNKLSLVNAFKYIIENLWPSDNKYINQKFCHENNSNKYYAPYELMNIIKNKFDSPKDLVNYIIMNLHVELNKKPNNIYAPNINYIPNQSDP